MLIDNVHFTISASTTWYGSQCCTDGSNARSCSGWYPAEGRLVLRWQRWRLYFLVDLLNVVGIFFQTRTNGASPCQTSKNDVYDHGKLTRQCILTLWDALNSVTGFVTPVHHCSLLGVPPRPHAAGQFFFFFFVLFFGWLTPYILVYLTYKIGFVGIVWNNLVGPKIPNQNHTHHQKMYNLIR